MRGTRFIGSCFRWGLRGKGKGISGPSVGVKWMHFSFIFLFLAAAANSKPNSKAQEQLAGLPRTHTHAHTLTHVSVACLTNEIQLILISQGGKLVGPHAALDAVAVASTPAFHRHLQMEF